jgi:hypothetical protein
VCGSGDDAHDPAPRSIASNGERDGRDNLEDGARLDDFLEWFPGVSRQQVEAVLEFAGRSLVEA